LLILNQSEIKELITMDEALKVNEDVYVSFSTGQSNVPQRINMELDTPDHFSLIMPGYVKDLDGLGIKVVTCFPENVQNGLPSTQAVIMLFDATNGVPIAMMDGTYITGLRTGTGTGVATNYLAREDAATLAIIGTGGMAPGQLEAISHVRKLSTVYVYNRTVSKAEEFINEMSRIYQDIRFELKFTSREALENADIVVTSTSSNKPLVKYEWLKKGAHINAIGGFNKYIQEIHEDVLANAFVVTVDGVMATSVTGDISVPVEKKLIKTEDIVEIGTFIHKNRKARKSEDDITFFKSVGLSSQDIALAVKVFQLAKQKGMGQEVDL
jgi:ornithine cyclodeaminase